MRHKYDTRGIVLGRAPAGETNAVLTILTADLGLVYARAGGVRRPGAKLAAALATFAESELTLVRGKEAWRVAGAVLDTDWFHAVRQPSRPRAARLCGLLLRLAPSESPEMPLYDLVRAFLGTLARTPQEQHDSAEALAALLLLRELGLDAGMVPEGAREFAPEALVAVAADRRAYITRVNRGIEASGL